MCQVLALIIIWGSWLAFDAGTTLTLSFQSVMALCVTNLCASAGALTWASITYFETGRWSLDSTFMGAIAGLVMITPAAGFIDLPTSLFFGVLGAVVCRQALRIKFTDFARKWRWVDNGDTFATHCVGGFLGTICTGLFAQKAVAAYGGVEVDGGVFFDGNIRQLGLQVVEALIGFTWSFVGSFAIIALIDCIPGLEVLAEDKYVVLGGMLLGFCFANCLSGRSTWAWTRRKWTRACMKLSGPGRRITSRSRTAASSLTRFLHAVAL
jgi:Amt family ammonium transporter